ncbi:carbonic anhydrase [Patellaria atrata CBS 101060]|uniref:Carbonic anhydrase n=1 Tax=Patellaria atrata CBS 101060 TaxID=1346257 RepID=A0A9P4VKC9_9PEZI|nr:carbonic anhydrase [Patellaria atrata CBS 101060]
MLQRSLVTAACLTAYVSANCLHATSQLRRRLTPEGGVEVSNFGYTNRQGPLNWANLAPENEACSTSKVQSPINLDETIPLAASAPVVRIENVESAEFENLGTTIETIVNGTTTFEGADFALQQFHLHTPSEHRINEEYFPLEMHMVHEAADGSGGLVVLAVLFQLSEDGSTTNLLTGVTQNLEEIEIPGRITETGPLDFAPLIDHLQTKPLVQYTGSLTTPPCAEGLTFLVTQEPLPIDVATFNKIKKVVKFNSRYTQNALDEGNFLALPPADLAALCATQVTEEPVLYPVHTPAAEHTPPPAVVHTPPPAEHTPPPAQHEAPPPEHVVVSIPVAMAPAAAEHTPPPEHVVAEEQPPMVHPVVVVEHPTPTHPVMVETPPAEHMPPVAHPVAAVVMEHPPPVVEHVAPTPTPHIMTVVKAHMPVQTHVPVAHA